MKQAHLFIKGDVIGVGFREWTAIVAKRFGVTGWVKNLGHEVEALLQSEEDTMRKMIAAIKQGPPIARVEDVEIDWEDATTTYNSFEVLR